MLQSGPSFYRIPSVAPVRGTGFTPGRSSPGASAVLHSAPGCSHQGRLFVIFSPLPRTIHSVAPGSPPDDPVRGLVPCFFPPRMFQSGATFYRFLSVASGAPVRGTGFAPGRFQSGGYCLASCRPGCSNPGRLFIIFSPLPLTLQSAAPGSPPDDPVRGLVPCFSPPRMLHSGPSFYRILSVASDAPVRGTRFTPGRSSPEASAVLLPASDAPIRGLILSYSLRCLGRSSPWHRVRPRTIQSGG